MCGSNFSLCAAPTAAPEARRQHQLCAQCQRQWWGCSALSQLLYDSCCEQQRRRSVTLADCCCEQQRRRSVTLADCCCGSRDVAASHSQTAVAAAETLQRHTRRLLLRQLRRCGVTLADCCCGSGDVAASHSQTAVAAAEMLRRHTRRLLLRQQRRCSVTLADRCCGSQTRSSSCLAAEVHSCRCRLIGGIVSANAD